MSDIQTDIKKEESTQIREGNSKAEPLVDRSTIEEEQDIDSDSTKSSVYADTEPCSIFNLKCSSEVYVVMINKIPYCYSKSQQTAKDCMWNIARNYRGYYQDSNTYIRESENENSIKVIGSSRFLVVTYDRILIEFDIYEMKELDEESVKKNIEESAKKNTEENIEENIEEKIEEKIEENIEENEDFLNDGNGWFTKLF